MNLYGFFLLYDAVKTEYLFVFNQSFFKPSPSWRFAVFVTSKKLLNSCDTDVCCVLRVADKQGPRFQRCAIAMNNNDKSKNQVLQYYE